MVHGKGPPNTSFTISMRNSSCLIPLSLLQKGFQIHLASPSSRLQVPKFQVHSHCGWHHENQSGTKSSMTYEEYYDLLPDTAFHLDQSTSRTAEIAMCRSMKLTPSLMSSILMNQRTHLLLCHMKYRSLPAQFHLFVLSRSYWWYISDCVGVEV